MNNCKAVLKKVILVILIVIVIYLLLEFKVISFNPEISMNAIFSLISLINNNSRRD